MIEGLEGFLKEGLQRIEAKLDLIKEQVHAIDLSNNTTRIKQEALEGRLLEAEKEIQRLKSSHERFLGVLKFLSIPGVISVLYAGSKMLGK